MKKPINDSSNHKTHDIKPGLPGNVLPVLTQEYQSVFLNYCNDFNVGFMMLDQYFNITGSNTFAADIFTDQVCQFTESNLWNDSILLYTEDCKPFLQTDLTEKITHSGNGKIEIRLRAENRKNRNIRWLKIMFQLVSGINGSNSQAWLLVIQEISEHKKNEIEIKKRLALEKVVTRISTRFTRVNSDTVHNQINQALKEIGILSKVDRSYVFLFHENRQTMSNTHEWCNRGITSAMKVLQDLPVSIFPWWVKQLENNQVIYFSDISEMPEEAQAEKKIIESQSIRSVLVVPVADSGNLIGFMGFDSVRNHKLWSDSDIRLLRLVAEIFGNAFKNIELTRQVEKHTRNLEELVELRTKEKNDLMALNSSIVESTDVIIVTTNLEGRILSINPRAEKVFGINNLSNNSEINFTSLIPPEELREIRRSTEHKTGLIPSNDFDLLIHASGQSSPAPFECSLTDRNKNILYVLLAISPVYDESGKISRYVTVAADISYRKEAEKAQVLQKAAFESFIYPLVITDVNGLVLWANQSYEWMTGFSRAEILNKKYEAIQRSGHDKNPCNKRIWQTIRKGQIWKGEMINKKKDGTLYTEELTIIPVKNKHGELINFVAVKIDITDKKRNEEIQKNLFHINETILNNVPDLFFRIDRNGTYLGANTRDEKSLFVSKDVFIGRNMKDMLPPEQAAQSLEMLNRAFETNSIVSYDYGLEVSGVLRYFENRVIIISENEALSVIRDVTEMKKSEEMLRIALAQLNTLIDNLQAGILFENTERKVVLVNKPFCEMFRISENPEQLYGTCRIELAKRNSVMMNNPNEFYHYITHAPEKTFFPETTEILLGTGHITEINLIPVKNGGSLIGYLWQYRDITERKRNENYAQLQKDLGFDLAVSSRTEDALKFVIRAAMKIGKVDAAGIYLHNDENNCLNLMYHEGFSDRFIRKVKKYSSGSVQYNLVQEGISIYQAATDLTGNQKLFQPEKIKMTGFFPIRYDNKIIGSLNVASYSWNQLSAYEKITLESVVSQIGGTLSRIKSQDNLLLSKENFQLMFNTIDDFIFILDDEGKIIKTNPIVIQRLNYTENELSGMHVSRVHPKANRKETIFTINEMLEGKRDLCSVPLQTKNGGLIPVETKVIKGKWNGSDALYGISRDISERLKAEESLRKSEARWQFALESSGDGIWDYNMITSEVYYSAQWKKMLGYKETEPFCTVDDWKNKIHPDDTEKVIKTLNTHLSGRESIFENEHRLKCKDGTWKWIYSRGRIISRDSAGNPERIIGTHTDISSRKKYEISLIESLKKEKELNELKSQFVSMTSHEFRTPLSTILATVESLNTYMDRMSQEEKIRKIDKINVNVIELKNILEKIQSLANIESGQTTFHPVLTEMIPYISNLLLEFPGQMKKKHPIYLEKVKEGIFAYIDQLMIKQVFFNVLSNADKYSPDGSPKNIRVVREKKMIKIYISDEGIGIPACDIKNILNPFCRGTNVQNIHGTGVGLSLANQFMVVHGGNLEFKSVLNKGTTVCISLQSAL